MSFRLLSLLLTLALAALDKPFRQVQHNALCAAALERWQVYRYPATHDLFF